MSTRVSEAARSGAEARRNCKILTGHVLDGILVKLEVGLDVNLTGVHGTETLQVCAGTRIQGLLQGAESIGEDFEVGGDISRDIRNSDNVERQSLVVRGEDDVEEGCRETGV